MPIVGPLATGRVDMVHRGRRRARRDRLQDRQDVTADTAEEHAPREALGQAEIYAQALAAATGMPVREVVFVYCKAGVEVRLREGAVVR